MAAPGADASDSTPVPRRGWRPSRATVGWVATSLAMLWALVGYRIVVAHEHAQGRRLYPFPAGGDHLYYSSMMLQYAGKPFLESLHTAADTLSYPLPWQRLLIGYLDPQIAPNMYPRVLLPLTATPFEPVFGVWAIVVPGILAALALPFVMLAAARRLNATRWLAVPLVLLLLTSLFDEYGTGAYTEPLVGLLLVGAAATLPWDRRRPSTADLCWLGFFTVAGSLTRQIAPAFCGLVLGAMLWGLVFGPDRRAWWRCWRLPALVSTVTAVVGTVAVQVWAPFDALAWFSHALGTTSPRQTLTHSIERLPRVFAQGLANVWTAQEYLLLLLLAMCVASALLLWRHPLTGGVLGAAAPMVLTVALAGSEPFRYTLPAIVLSVLLVSVAMTRLWPGAAVSTVPATEPATEPAAEPATEPATEPVAEPAPEPATEAARPRRLPAVLWIATPLVLTAVVLGATVLLHRPSATVEVGTVTAADLGGHWQLTVDSLTLTCGGDNGQVWGTTPDGERVSVSGTAMARSFGTPSVVTLESGGFPPASLHDLVFLAVQQCPGDVGAATVIPASP